MASLMAERDADILLLRVPRLLFIAFFGPFGIKKHYVCQVAGADLSTCIIADALWVINCLAGAVLVPLLSLVEYKPTIVNIRALNLVYTTSRNTLVKW